ncbi:JAB domain-containing protein [Aquimarina longa]|uniref:JAB domain-containing protein n=1 Tax=Aquimarina longa TaxID=1080221 RepID=UPI00078097B0|nr:JAB domain-containing protein [Aquimarina longa]
MNSENPLIKNRLATYKDFVGELKVTYKRTTLATQKIKSSRDASNFMKPYFDLCMDDKEEAKILHLNRKNCVVNVTNLTKGSDSNTLIPIKDILRDVLLIKTNSIILFHNHPSGSLEFSNSDISVSKKLKVACELLEISLLDSIILTRESYSSMNDECLF